MPLGPNDWISQSLSSWETASQPSCRSSRSASDPWLVRPRARLVGYDGVVPRLFAVIRTRGPAYRADRQLEAQDAWQAHANFMNALLQDGFVVIGGPLEDGPDVLHIVRADSAESIAARLAGDPWEPMGLLRTVRIAPWSLRLGTLS